MEGLNENWCIQRWPTENPYVLGGWTEGQTIWQEALDHPSMMKLLKKQYRRETMPEKKSYLYLTLSPDKFLRNLNRTDENLKNLNTWCEKWFNQDKKFYNSFAWVIESGSHGDHLHVHAVCEMKSSHKHAEKLKAFWAKYFPNNQLLTTKCLSSKSHTTGEYCYLRFDSQQILEDKLEYFQNEKKGTHENLHDEGLRGSRGFLTDNI